MPSALRQHLLDMLLQRHLASALRQAAPPPLSAANAQDTAIEPLEPWTHELRAAQVRALWNGWLL